MITQGPQQLTAPAPLLCSLVCLLAFAAVALAGPGQAGKPDKDNKRPNLSLKASPSVSFSPSTIFLVAELKGGPNDYQEYYCAGVEWDWGDGTKSESSYDCEPYEPGKSEIRRRFTTEHVYRTAGLYQIQVRLKRKDKVLVSANTSVQVRPGVRDPSIGF